MKLLISALTLAFSSSGFARCDTIDNSLDTLYAICMAVNFDSAVIQEFVTAAGWPGMSDDMIGPFLPSEPQDYFRGWLGQDDRTPAGNFLLFLGKPTVAAPEEFHTCGLYFPETPPKPFRDRLIREADLQIIDHDDTFNARVEFFEIASMPSRLLTLSYSTRGSANDVTVFVLHDMTAR